jgi:hypothetical protein
MPVGTTYLYRHAVVVGDPIAVRALHNKGLNEVPAHVICVIYSGREAMYRGF